MENGGSLKTVSYNNLGRYGRLGNQMFQYAALIGTSRLLERNSVAPVGARVGESCLRECFRLGACTDAYESEVFAQYKEGGFNFDVNMVPEMMKVEGNIDMVGYFQSDKYWKHCEDQVMREFKFHDSNHMSVNKWISDQKVNPEEYVSIHVRRGDYVNLQHTHPVQKDGYYLQALEFFPEDKFIVFSDDPNLAENSDLFGSLDNAVFSDLNQYQDLNLMSRCKGHIIANSSFSWWGAALGGGRTIAPKEWFGPRGPNNWDDVYRDDWVIV